MQVVLQRFGRYCTLSTLSIRSTFMASSGWELTGEKNMVWTVLRSLIALGLVRGNDFVGKFKRAFLRTEFSA